MGATGVSEAIGSERYLLWRNLVAQHMVDAEARGIKASERRSWAEALAVGDVVREFGGRNVLVVVEHLGPYGSRRLVIGFVSKHAAFLAQGGWALAVTENGSEQINVIPPERIRVVGEWWGSWDAFRAEGWEEEA